MNYQITKQDLQALRDCDGVGIYYEHNANRTGQMRLEKETSDDIYGTASSYYSMDGIKTRIPPSTRKASAYVHNARREEWQAIAWALKAGDEIVIEYRENNNGYVDHAITTVHGYEEDLAAFECLLHVYRGKRHFAFLVDYRVCPHNTAAMIERSMI